jgi:hypothetical protein
MVKCREMAANVGGLSKAGGECRSFQTADLLKTKARKRFANVLGGVAHTDHPNPIHDL